VATFDYNPITGQLDLVGGGASYIDGVVADSSLLPVTLGTPALDAVYLAKAGSGVWLINRKPAGLYVRVANNGVAADWTYLGAFPEVNSSANWSLYDGTTPSKELKFDLSAISTSTVRTLTVPDASGTLARTEDFAAPPAIGNTTPAAGTFTTLTASTSLALTGGIITGASNVIEQVSSTSAQTFRIYNTFTSATNHERGFLKWSSNAFQIGTEAGSGGGTARAVELVHGGGVVLRSINSTGLAIPNGCQLVMGNNASLFYWNGGPIIRQEANYTLALRDGNNANTVRIYNTWASTTSFERLNIIAQSGGDVLVGTEKGTTGGLARGLQLQTDNTTRLTIGSTGGFTLADAQDIAVGTTTGTKIGTATTQKIGFFNATPVVQQAAVADATDAASTQARLNDLLARLRTLGLIAT
jgi:hypothetical protein